MNAEEWEYARWTLAFLGLVVLVATGNFDGHLLGGVLVGILVPAQRIAERIAKLGL